MEWWTPQACFKLVRMRHGKLMYIKSSTYSPQLKGGYTSEKIIYSVDKCYMALLSAKLSKISNTVSGYFNSLFFTFEWAEESQLNLTLPSFFSKILSLYKVITKNIVVFVCSYFKIRHTRL